MMDDRIHIVDQHSPAALLRAKAYADLGVTEIAVARVPQITPQLRTIAATIRREGQPEVTRKAISQNTVVTIVEDTRQPLPYGPGADLQLSWVAYLETTSDDESIRVLDAYRSLPKYLASRLPVEAFCVAAGVSPIRILGILTAACVQMGAHASSIIAAVNHPRVVQKTVDMALTDDGVTDRRMLHQATRFLPTAKGATTTVNVQQSAVATSVAASTAAPSPENTIRRMVDRFNDRAGTAARPPAQLEASVTTPVPEPAVRVQPDAVAVTVDAEYEDED